MATLAPPLQTTSKFAPLLRPLHAFLAAETAGGILLMLAAVAALVWANSPWANTYDSFWHLPLTLGFGTAIGAMSLQHFVNDALMAIFFLLVGLEIKRELLFGELASVRRAVLPVAAALGGMLVPALFYALFNARGSGALGWGIPMATDIAFAVGVVAIVGRSLPTSVKVFLLAVAIVDDLGAVLVIAIFYTHSISLLALGAAALCLAILLLLNLWRVHSPLAYLFFGVALWIATYYSGLHATVAGVLLAFTIPATRQLEEAPYLAHTRHLLDRFAADAAVVPDKITEDQSHALLSIQQASSVVQTVMSRVEHALLKPVNLVIMPVFALANAGVDVRTGIVSSLTSPVAIGIIAGLILGKPLGILLASWLTIKCGAATLPDAATWPQIAGVAVLCGIGFTMALFVSGLAFAADPSSLSAAKAGILLASLAAGILGSAILVGVRHKPQGEPS